MKLTEGLAILGLRGFNMTINYSTNEILFDCEADCLNNSPDHKYEVDRFLYSYEFSNGNEEIGKQNYSHDNFTGIYCWYAHFFPANIRSLPIFGKFAIHPLRFMWYFLMKFPIIGLVFLPFIVVDMSITCLEKTKTNKDGTIQLPTSSKLLVFFQLLAMVKRGVLGAKLLKSIMASFVKYATKDWERVIHLNAGWDRVFGIYYKEDHRVNIAYNHNKG